MFKTVKSKREQKRNGLIASFLGALIVCETLSFLGVTTGWQIVAAVITGIYVGTQENKWWPVEVDKKASI